MATSTTQSSRHILSFADYAAIRHPTPYLVEVERDGHRLLLHGGHHSSDPADPHFSFSFGGQALYVIGMHAKSSREARRFRWPALVFNPHEQFERLRADGKWKHMQETIRHRDLVLQGTINPMLSDFGEHSEARQYSGRIVAARHGGIEDGAGAVGQLPLRRSADARLGERRAAPTGRNGFAGP